MRVTIKSSNRLLHCKILFQVRKKRKRGKDRRRKKKINFEALLFRARQREETRLKRKEAPP